MIRDVEGDTKILRTHETYTRHLRGVRFHVANVSSSALKSLRVAELLHGKLRHGEWKITVHPTVDMAIASIPEDVLRCVVLC